MSNTKTLKVVGVPMDKEQYRRFVNYKKREHIQADAEAGRKLIFERLDQKERENKEAA